ncbi:MAG TPA: nuclear transport factor 2 family protein [Solirubrobacteraceae bacterium]|jgi:ketosteroid isomerase-like protein|nr:nuclear transport factor 2 family protein [Solirubrobacteraceae bacterium]
MAISNIERARRGYAALASGNVAAIREMLDPEVKWHGGVPEDGCQNRDEALAFIQRDDRPRLPQLVDVIDAGEDRVVVILQPPARGGETPPLRANVTTFRDGRVAEMVAYESPEEACAAAGVPPKQT